MEALEGASPHLLEMDRVSKAFLGVPVLNHVSLLLDEGEVLGVVGENGAGKSTLMKILAGVYQSDEGTIKLGSEAFAPHKPRDALNAGIIVVHQELSQFPDQTVAENIFAGGLPARRLEQSAAANSCAMRAPCLIRLAWTSRHRHAFAACRLPNANWLRSVGLCRAAPALSSLDEPTATLTSHEVHILVVTVCRLKKTGVGIIFISHHLEEVFEICDRVTVMRDGYSVETRAVQDWTEETLVRAMVNRPISSFFPKQDIKLGPLLLEVEDLSSGARFADVSFDVRAGEIYGIAGLVGAGRTEILKTIFGALPMTGGRIRIDGKGYIPHSPRRSLQDGMVLTPEDRKAEGLILPFSIRQNIALSTLKSLARWGILSSRAIQRLANGSIESLRIRATSAGQQVRRLSGGNQQKVVLARAMSTSPRVFLLDEPTRGVDVGAKVEVYNLIGQLAVKGSGHRDCLVGSSRASWLCDRIGVMRAGRMAGEVERAQFSQDRLMSLAAVG